MAFNGSGQFNRVHDWTTDKTNTVPVTASRMDDEMDGMATGLSTAICKDGQTTTTARVPFAAGTSAMSGAVSGVSYAHTNDANTGLYFPAADQWGMSAGGTATLTSTATKLTTGVAVDFGGAATPTSSDGAALGSTSQMWSDLFLASGGVINFNNGDVTVTHSANTLAFAGASSGYTFDAAATITGALSASGNFAINTNQFTVAAADGATVIAGSLSVGSAATLSSVAGDAIASQAEMEAAATAGKIVTPARVNFHPGVAKVEGLATVSGGTPTLQAGSYNVTSITDSATGLMTVTIATDFSDAAKATMHVTIESDSSEARYSCLQTTGRSAGTMVLQCATQAGTNTDPAAWQFVGFGDQ